MINKTYLDNRASKNILNDYEPINLSENISNNYINSSLTNMVLNSNLETKDFIK